jgi:hypothetical protein
MNYKIVEKNNIWHVIETQTEHLIKSFFDQKEAKSCQRHLNFGGAFDGWTPNFFLKSSSLNNQND